jgi:DNA polymerase-3 subunit alpha
MAALLSSEIEDGNKRDIMVEHIADARRLGVAVLPPDVNASDGEFGVVGGKILFGLTAIKGVGHGAAESIVRARREGGRFKDFFDFCERIDSRAVTRGALERLVKAGACDGFGRRAQLLAVLPHALQAASQRQEDRRQGQRNLFEATAGGEPEEAAPVAEALPDLPEWPDSEKLKYEKEALDFYFSSHPLAEHEEDVRRFSTHTVSQLGNLGAGQEVIVGGMLTQVRFMNTKKARNGNSRYVRCKLEDFTGAAECVMWPDDFVRYKDEVREDRVCFVKATVERTREEPGLVLSRILDIEQARRELTKGLVLLLRLGAYGEEDEINRIIDALGRVLQRAPGPCPTFLTVRDEGGRRCLLKLGAEFAVNPATVAVGELETLLGEGAVKFSGPFNGSGRNGSSD